MELSQHFWPSGQQYGGAPKPKQHWAAVVQQEKLPAQQAWPGGQQVPEPKPQQACVSEQQVLENELQQY
jgi:hypothetical protein